MPLEFYETSVASIARMGAARFLIVSVLPCCFSSGFRYTALIHLWS
jgi:hypothetical protein